MKVINLNTNQNLDENPTFIWVYTMQAPFLYSLNFIFLSVSFNLFGLSAQEIDYKIEGAKLFNDFFWVGNESTLFLKADKKETFTGLAKAYYPTQNKKKQIRKITNYQKGRPIETVVWKPDGTRCEQTNLKDVMDRNYIGTQTGKKGKTQIIKTASQTGNSPYGTLTVKLRRKENTWMAV
jgi:hypothetical protein